MGQSGFHTFIEISFIEIVRTRDVHIVKARYLDRHISTLIRNLTLSLTILRCGDLGSAVEA